MYAALSQLEGIHIPRCWGGYTLNHEDRELPDDRSINVLLFEQIDGPKLSNTWALRLSVSHKSLMCDKIKAIAQEMNDRGVVWPCVYADNFIVEKNTGRIVAYDFSGTLLQDQSYSRYDWRMQVYSQNNLINEFLGSLGYQSELEDLRYLSL